MEVVRSSLVSFDAVCMATALHTMASLNMPNQYERLPDDPDFQQLMQMIGMVSDLKQAMKHPT